MKRIMKKYLAKQVQDKVVKRTFSGGFTLVELLVGAALTTTVVAAAGYGVSNMISSSTATNARSERRAELNRSLDFIASEIRESSSLVKDVSAETEPSDFASSYAGKVVSGSVSKVLMIKTEATGSVPIIYYVAQPTSGIWKGPKVVYRWGPSFNSTGSYSNASTPASWVSEALVDKIQDSGATPSCASGTLNGVSGFYSCVDSAGKTAQIFQNGKVAKVLGSSETYGANLNTGSRKTTVTQQQTLIASGAPAPAPFFNIVNGGVDVLKPATVKVETLAPPSGGGSGYPVATSIRVAVQPKGTDFTKAVLQAGTFQGDARGATSKTYTVPAGQTISIAACSNNSNTSTNMNGPFTDYTNSSSYEIQYCPISTNTNDQGNLSSYTNYANSGGVGKTVFTLKNGDEIPAVKPASGQSSAAAFLNAYADPADANSTVKHLKLTSNQVIYLFEFATRDKTNQYHDLQDTVVLVTFS